MSRITHFEIYGNAPEALATFYRALFGWHVQKMEGLAYWRIAIDADGSAPAGGGITQPPPATPPGWLPYVQVAAIDEALATAERLGGKIVRPKSAVARTCWIATLEDPAGSRFAIWQPDVNAFPLPEPD